MFSSIGNTDEYVSGAIAPAALRLFLPRRYCEQSSIILASCESNSLLVFLTHMFSARTRPSLSATLHAFLVSLSFGFLKASKKADLQRGPESVYTSPTTLRSTTAENGRYKTILSPISQRSKPSRKFRQQISRRYRSLLSSSLSLGQVSTLTRIVSPADIAPVTQQTPYIAVRVVPQNNNVMNKVLARAASLALEDFMDEREELIVWCWQGRRK